MTEKKKLSTAEILALARKGAAGGTPPTNEPKGSEPAAENPSAEPEAESPPPAPKAAEKPAAKPAAPGGKMSTSDILAAARAKKAAEAAPAAAKPAAEKPAPKAAPKTDKPAAKAEKPAAASAGGPKDTASILAAARGGARPGPVSKAEAASAKGATALATKEKPAKPSVPPMPARPDFAAAKAKAAAAAKPAAKAGAKGETDEDRRGLLGLMLGTMVGLGFSSLGAVTALWTLGTARFMFPNVLTEPPSQFKVGFPADFPFGSVSEKFKAQFGVWIVNWEYNGQQQIYALRTVCTHLGCTPNWLEGEQKFKCPCHGSGFYKDGINFEGPAPRPLERFAIRRAADGQLEVDKSKLFQEEMGQWADPTSFVTA